MKSETNTAKLIVAATPIDGDWRKLDSRLIEAIRAAKLLIAEEQKTGLRFLAAAESVDTPLRLLNEHSTDADRLELVQIVRETELTVFVSDAGTPCIADPDYRFVDLCIKAGVELKSIPGPTSITAALSVAGFSTDRFIFMGFPPRDKAKRKAFFAELAATKYTAVFLERPYAMRQTLEDMLVIKQPVSLSIALGTEAEQNVRGNVREIMAKVEIVKQAFAVVVSANNRYCET
ncbi:MAG: hypothetical protein LBV04_05990 [Deferribacteraceae bacterium]|nr:hypothetical protein [Deferribacteraceae bacterium]